jgi:3-oxoacyl-[acyl-carrier protein] reductase
VHVWGTRPRAADYAGESGSDLEGLHYARVDVADADTIATVALPFDRLDVLVCAQGIVRYRREEFKLPAFREVVNVNLVSLMACGDRFHDMLARAGGSMIIVSSAAAFHSTVGTPAYNASKTGAFGLTRTLGEAWARDGIRVNGIAPGLVATKLTRVTTDHPERLEASLRKIPLGRLGTPADMAGAALFLASPLAAYVLGQTLLVDGGLLLA